MLANTPDNGSLCPCGKTSRSEMERISRGVLIKTFFFWLPVKRYMCYKCKHKKWIMDRPPVKNGTQKRPVLS